MFFRIYTDSTVLTCRDIGNGHHQKQQNPPEKHSFVVLRITIDPVSIEKTLLHGIEFILTYDVNPCRFLVGPLASTLNRHG